MVEEIKNRFQEIIKRDYTIRSKHQEFIEKTRNELLEILTEFSSSHSGIKNTFREKSLIRPYLQKFILSINEVNKSLLEARTNEVKNWKIFKEFEDDFLIMGFGMVNSGKSTLANTIADFLKENGGTVKYFRRIEKDVQMLPPQNAIGRELAVARYFGSFKGDGHGQMPKDIPEWVKSELRKNNFKITKRLADWFEKTGERKIPVVRSDATEEIEITRLDEDHFESTTAIQGFRCGSIVWIDSPGTNSLTIRHEKLAKEFSKFANLIIYCTDGKEQLRHTDLNELKDFYVKGRPLFLVVTKCDDIEEKSVFGVLRQIIVPLTEEEIKKRKEYIYQVIEKSKLKGWLEFSQIFPVSSELWRRGKRKESGLYHFFEILSEQIQKKAEKMKIKTPLDSFKDLVEKVVNQIDSRKSALQELRKKMEDLFNRLDKFKEQVINCFLSSYGKEIDHILRAKQKELKRGPVDVHYSGKRYKELIQNALKDVLKSDDFKGEIKKICAKFNPSNKDFYGELKKVYQTLTRKSTYEKHGRAWGRGIGELGGSFIGGCIGSVGGQLGILLGVSLGNLLGDWLGGEVGGEVGKAVSREIKYRACVGDNITEVHKQLLQKGEEQARNDIDSHFIEFKEDCQRLLSNIDLILENWNGMQKRLTKLRTRLITTT
jgi:predicted  nucleic acid-binding Zn-ribbon protein